jgi:predicted HAD superfamily Cof-like phosphohydrolase
MSEQFKLVQKMHKKFGLQSHEVQFSPDEMNFRITAMIEEINEYKDSLTHEDWLDALIDLEVFTLGTIDRMGYGPIYEEAFRRVMEANLKKQLGSNGEKRNNFQLDLIKPEGWKAPDHSDLIKSLTNGPIHTHTFTPDAILGERGNRYGSFKDNANSVQDFMRIYERESNWKYCSNYVKETIHMIIHKMARIIHGDVFYDDSYKDIIGYATLCLSAIVESESYPAANYAFWNQDLHDSVIYRMTTNSWYNDSFERSDKMIAYFSSITQGLYRLLISNDEIYLNQIIRDTKCIMFYLGIK